MLRTLFVLSIFVPGFAAALRNRFAALLLYLWFALFRPQDWLWIDVTALRLSLVLGVVLIVPAFATGILPNLAHPLSISMLLFVVSGLLGQFGAVRPDVGWEWIDFMTRLIVTALLLVTLVRTPRRLVMALGVVSASMGYHTAKAGLAWILGGGSSRFADGLAGAFTDNNGYALGTVMIMPMLVAAGANASLVYQGRFLPWVKRGFYAAAALCVFTVIGTYSRGGFLSLIAAALVFVLLQRRRFTALTALAACALVGVLVVPIPQNYIDRLQTIRSYEQTGEESAISRTHFWAVGLRMGLARPFGVGLRQYQYAYDLFDFSHGRYGHHRAVHNSHVQVFAELGFFGTLVWAAAFTLAFLACFRVRARARLERMSDESRRFLTTSANALITSMVGFLVGGTFLSLALNDITWLTFALVASLDYISADLAAEAAVEPVYGRVAPALAFRVVDSFATVEGRHA